MSTCKIRVEAPPSVGLRRSNCIVWLAGKTGLSLLNCFYTLSKLARNIVHFWVILSLPWSMCLSFCLQHTWLLQLCDKSWSWVMWAPQLHLLPHTDLALIGFMLGVFIWLYSLLRPYSREASSSPSPSFLIATPDPAAALPSLSERPGGCWHLTGTAVDPDCWVQLCQTRNPPAWEFSWHWTFALLLLVQGMLAPCWYEI